ncbi:MAG: hypothetical protein FWH03_07820 [Firmicutes bacterium]|nr:hypothetical protein [Bacillota bacterium]
MIQRVKKANSQTSSNPFLRVQFFADNLAHILYCRIMSYYRKIYWNRIAVFLIVLSLLGCGAILYFVYSRPSAAHITVAPRSYHYVVTGAFDTQQEAAFQGTQLRNGGGAGYVLGGSETFLLAAAVYLTPLDANTVAARLSADGISADTHVLHAPQLRMQTRLPQADAEAFADFFYAPHDWLQSLYRMTLDLDQNRIAENHALVSLQALQTRIQTTASALVPYANQPAAPRLQAAYADILHAFSNASDRVFGTTLSVNLKYLLCAAAEIHINLLVMENG